MDPLADLRECFYERKIKESFRIAYDIVEEKVLTINRGIKGQQTMGG